MESKMVGYFLTLKKLFLLWNVWKLWTLFYFIVERKHEIYRLKFLVAQYRITDYRYNVIWQISRTYSSCLIEALRLLFSTPLVPLPPPSGNHHSTFDSMNLFVLNASSRRTHSVFVFLWPSYFTQHNALNILPCGHILKNLFFFKAEYMPLYV